jgi:hypothetical protein
VTGLQLIRMDVSSHRHQLRRSDGRTLRERLRTLWQ